MFKTIRAVLVILPLSALARAQTQPESPDLQSVIQELSTSAGAALDEARERAAHLPATAIVPMWDYLADVDHPETVRREIATALQPIYERARALRLKEDQQALVAWCRASGIDVFRKTEHDAQLDPLVAQAFQDFDSGSPNAAKSLKAAIDAGCTDPLVQFDNFCARGSIDPADATRQCMRLVIILEKSSYPASQKMFANLKFLEWAMKVGERSLITTERKNEILNRALELFPAYIKENPGRPAIKKTMMTIFDDAHRLKGYPAIGHRQEAFDAVYPTFARALPDSPLLYQFIPKMYISPDFPNPHYLMWRPAPGEIERFDDSMKKSGEAAKKAWRLDPLDREFPTAMIDVATEEGLDHDLMEVWFSRAMCADPHSLDTCRAKERYLANQTFDFLANRVRSEDGAKDLLEFGRWCVRTGDGKDRLPVIMIDVENELHGAAEVRDEYFKQPGVWQDLQQAYEKLLSDKTRMQTDRKACMDDRGAYIRAACDAGQWKEALRLIDLYGEDFSHAALHYSGPFSVYKAQIAEKAAGQ